MCAPQVCTVQERRSSVRTRVAVVPGRMATEDQAEADRDPMWVGRQFPQEMAGNAREKRAK
jgi:hypothetical protein